MQELNGGAPAGPRPGPLDGEELAGRYHVRGLIARGGMADVYRADDPELDRTVAIKLFRAGSAPPARFRNEVALLARLRHPHLVPLLDAGDHAGLPFVVLELYGGTLAQRIAGGPLSPRAVAEIGRGLASALDHIHRAGVVHRDVKPSNILLDDDGRALLADLGVARLVDGTRITTGATAPGTPGYLAPEQVTEGEAQAPADVYSLGLVLLETLTGTRAFEGTYHEQLAARAARPPAVPPSVPGPWRALLASMTRPDPRGRPSAADVAAALPPPGPPDDDATVLVAPVDAPTPVPAYGAPAHAPPAHAPPAHGPPAHAPPAHAPPAHGAPGHGAPGPGGPLPPPRVRTAWLAGAIALGTAALIGLAFLTVGASRPDTPRLAATPATTPGTAAPGTASGTPAASGTAATKTTETTAASPTTRDTSAPAAPPGSEPEPTCAELRAELEEIAARWPELNQEYRHDRATRDRLRAELEQRKQAIQEEMVRLGC